MTWKKTLCSYELTQVKETIVAPVCLQKAEHPSVKVWNSLSNPLLCDINWNVFTTINHLTAKQNLAERTKRHFVQNATTSANYCLWIMFYITREEKTTMFLIWSFSFMHRHPAFLRRWQKVSKLGLFEIVRLSCIYLYSGLEVRSCHIKKTTVIAVTAAQRTGKEATVTKWQIHLREYQHLHQKSKVKSFHKGSASHASKWFILKRLTMRCSQRWEENLLQQLQSL